MPCYRCGVRQTDPERGHSPWRRGVIRDHQVLVCPACQERTDWTVGFERCARCGSVHLIRRLDEVACLDCGQARVDPVALAPDLRAPDPVPAPDPGLADEVGRALDRVLGRT